MLKIKIRSPFIGPKRRTVLERHNWYRNMAGGYAHPHAIDHMTRKEILDCTPERLEYKCVHGSMSEPPGYVRDGKTKTAERMGEELP